MPFWHTSPPRKLQSLTFYRITDADNPPKAWGENAHYGWEVFVNNVRCEVPHHIYFATSVEPKHCREIEMDLVIVDDLDVNRSDSLGTGSLKSEIIYCRDGVGEFEQ